MPSSKEEVPTSAGDGVKEGAFNALGAGRGGKT